jgi:glutamate/tyrosine decarboxylase-like PLP-dependent enzyme
MTEPLTDLHFLDRALRHAQDYLARLKEIGIAHTADVVELRQRLGRALTDNGVSPEQVIDELVRDAAPGLTNSASGRFFGWVIGGTLPAALAADWLTSTWDQNVTIAACSPASAVAEEIAGAWLKELLALPMEASFAFTTGCQLAHVTCLAAARHALLKKARWDVDAKGLSGAPKIRILANAQHHGSIARAVAILGLGRENIVPIATDVAGRIVLHAFEVALAASPSAPTIVALQAGDIATGAYDDFASLIPVAKRHGAWVHIDGAFGLWARASPRYCHLARGAEVADSWATDGHKILNTPFDCGYAFVAHPDAHRAAFSLRASYLTHADDARDAIDWTPDWSRRARGFTTYAALRSLGRKGAAQLFETYCDRTCALADGLAALPGVELLSAPIINQALVRFRASQVGAGESDHNRRTEEVIAAINATGEAFFSGTMWHSSRAMRISVCNWRTDADDVTRAIAAVRKVLFSKSRF